MNWYANEQHPAEGETCLVIWTDSYGDRKINTAKWNGKEWEIEVDSEYTLSLDAEMFDAWAPWDWPSVNLPEQDEEVAGKEGEERDGSADPND